MYEAKRRGRNRFELFDRALHDRTVTRLTLEHDLRNAVRDERLSLVYQPIVTLADGSVHAVEALLRWSRETGPVSPAEFIPVAEQTGLIVELGAWVLREACAQLAAWRARPGPTSHLRMRVNVSARQLTTAGFLDALDGALRAADVPPSALGLEITEGVLLDTSDQVLGTLEAVRDRGVEILLDDFGTGFSSLSYLQRFPIDAMKIDRSFVAQLEGGDLRSRAIVDAVVRMGQALEIGTVAEGIETEAQLAVLVGLGCDRGQGYLLGRPCRAEDLDLP
jgi:EAL domain-containing protein (putative c-di-GMP-specific phosphodiesterase class I)